MNKKREELISFLLRIGLAFSFFYAAISSLTKWENWIGFIPGFLDSIISGFVLLTLVSVFQILLGLWLLSNKKIFYASVLSVLTIFIILIFNLAVLDVVFRDVAILLMAVALAVLYYRK